MAAMFLVAVVLVASFALYLLQKYNFRHWAKRGIVHDEPHILFGNLGKLFKMKQTIHQFLDEQYKKFPNAPMVGFYGLSKPFLIIRDLDLIKDITIKDFNYFTSRNLHPHGSVDRLGAKIMFTSRGDHWRSIRHKASTAFTSGKLRSTMYPQVKAVGKEIMDVYSESVQKSAEEIDVRDYSMRYAVDVITACAFGSQGNAVKNPDTSLMYSLFRETMSFDFKQGVASNLIFFARPAYLLFGKLGFQLFPKFIEDNMEKIVETAYHQRVQEKTRTGDIFDQIVWTDDAAYQGLENKTAAAFQMLLAGSETSATTITFALYELAREPQIQDRLRSEITKALAGNNGAPDYDLNNKIEYLDLVVKETMRLWPILPFMDRYCEKDYQVPGTNLVIEKGSQIFIPLYSIQRDPAYFPDPDKFDPERFRKENIEGLHEMAYIPFGAGPRYCIGKRFGIMSVKNFLVHFLPKYEVRLTEETSGELQWNTKSFTLYLKNGMKLKVSPIKTVD